MVSRFCRRILTFCSLWEGCLSCVTDGLVGPVQAMINKGTFAHWNLKNHHVLCIITLASNEIQTSRTHLWRASHNLCVLYQ